MLGLHHYIAAKGWIWSIKSYENDLVTGSWDSTISRWHLSSSSLQQTASYKLQTPVLCSNFITPNSIIIGTYNALYHLDLREPTNKRIPPLNSYHKNSILCVETVFSSYRDNTSTLDDSTSVMEYEEFHEEQESLPRSLSTISLFSQCDEPLLEEISINPTISKDPSDSLLYVNPQPGISFFTGCKDKYVCAWDLRAPSNPLVKFKLKNYPRLMSLNDNSELWVCEPPDKVHLFDVRHRASTDNEKDLDASLNLISSSTIPSSTCRGFGCLKATPTCLFLGLLSGEFGAYYPGNYSSLAKEMDGSPLCVDYSDECLVVGSGIGLIHMWISKNRASKLM
ncbi:hypothetical protein Ciccas_001565 [Cichlidogyrus casuarinus]|uniref:Uncharacterized protein n=1 Tax=Cichlidogyrus casuarinus TaxID=1844966 RepID=A0ABD2QJS3_9PLAT